jgi:hypothetical protein
MRKPLWQLFVDGTHDPVAWVDYPANTRFAIHNQGTTSPADDVVLDRETRLVWTRDANIMKSPSNWLDANTQARELTVANRRGWRVPTIEELSTLIDVRRQNPALPNGHPFVGVQVSGGNDTYWTSTNHENPSGAAWFVNLSTGAVGLATKGGNPQILGFAWPVRGGSGSASWNW